MAAHEPSALERLLNRGAFAVTAEVVPPRSAEPREVTAQARALAGYADAVNVTDNPTSSAHMSPVAGAALVAAAGLEPVMQLTIRDRNRLALTGDLLGGWAVGARGVLCLTGDPTEAGDQPDAEGVFDLDVLELVRLAVSLRREGRLLSGARVEPAPGFLVGVADVPLAEGYDFARLEAKADAGAMFVQTQIVFDVDAFGEWAENAQSRGVFERLFVLGGVAVCRGAATARYLREHLPGVAVPDEVVRRLEDAGESAPEVGVQIAVEIVAKLKAIQGLAGVHLMGLGHLEPVQKVVQTAGLLPRPAVA